MEKLNGVLKNNDQSFQSAQLSAKEYALKMREVEEANQRLRYENTRLQITSQD